ncbi:hypothetical protein ACFCYH_22210, partial [Streptomyces sp. NPDC056400]
MLPQARFAAPDAESGRDPLLVDSLAGSWGTPPTPEGKAVWFSLPLPSPRRWQQVVDGPAQGFGGVARG